MKKCDCCESIFPNDYDCVECCNYFAGLVEWCPDE